MSSDAEILPPRARPARRGHNTGTQTV